MIDSLTERVVSIYDYVESSLDKETFYSVNSKADIYKPEYLSSKNMLKTIRQTTGVMYLYTAKEKENGDLIYIVDGLDRSSLDFRYPGDLIEPEIQGDMQLALSGSQVLPNGIKITDWGKIFIAYMPIHDGDSVVGVVGIEFEAEHQYNTYLLLRILAPIILLLSCSIATVCAVLIFRRISNPHFKDMSNTDQLTQLKNRNAFEIDMNNMIAANAFSGVGIVVVDLDNLKKVNDLFGHRDGDYYIQKSAGIIRDFGGENMVFYRTGGDEFAIIVYKTEISAMKEYLARLNQAFSEIHEVWSQGTSLSIGYAMYDPKIDRSILDTYQRADDAMYENKMEKESMSRRKLQNSLKRKE